MSNLISALNMVHQNLQANMLPDAKLVQDIGKEVSEIVNQVGATDPALGNRLNSLASRLSEGKNVLELSALLNVAQQRYPKTLR